jgi:hypothetical protein
VTARSEFTFSCRPETASRLFGASFFVVDRLTGKPIHIDTGNSYFGLCNLIHRLTKGEDGVYFTYTDDNPIAFNPFYTADKMFDIKKRESIKTLLLTLWKGGVRETTVCLVEGIRTTSLRPVRRRWQCKSALLVNTRKEKAESESAKSGC